MEPVTLAGRLGTTAYLSALLLKAGRLGLTTPIDLERLAVSRGLRYYDSHGDSLKGEGLVLYGRAALYLGFSDAPETAGPYSRPVGKTRRSYDGDAIDLGGKQPSAFRKYVVEDIRLFRCRTYCRA